MALEATDRRDTQASIAAAEGPAKYPCERRRNWVSVTSQPLSPNVRVRVPRR